MKVRCSLRKTCPDALICKRAKSHEYDGYRCYWDDQAVIEPVHKEHPDLCTGGGPKGRNYPEGYFDN